MNSPAAKSGVAIAAALVLLGTAACGGGGSNGQGEAIVAETNFDLQTIDPARQFEFTGSTIDDQLYQTALTFEDGDLTKPTDGLCSFEMSEDQKELTLTMVDKEAKFSDGSPVEVDDIVFSYQRVQGIQGNPSFFLDGVTVEKVDDETLKLTSEDPNPALPYILPNSSLGIVNQEVVEENGGTTDESDDAEQFLNENSQGSGPYMIDSYKPDSEVVMVANEHYSGPEPKFKRVVLRNVSKETQLTDVQSGQSHVAYDLAPDQISTLDENSVNVTSVPSQYTLFMFMNQDEGVSDITSNPDFQSAVRLAIDYDKILELAGEGSKRMAGVVPEEFLGSVPLDQAKQRDVEEAKSLLEKAGYDGEAIPFHFSSDQAVEGVSVAQLAETLQSQLKEVGIELELSPAPSTAQLDGFRSGDQPMGLAQWGADYPDPSNYLVFTPGGTVSQRVNWAEGDSPEIDELVTEARAAAGEDERGAAYEKLYAELNDKGPFVPLVQPMGNVVVSSSITKYVSNADTSFEFATAE